MPLGTSVERSGVSELLPCPRCGFQFWWPTANPGGIWYDTNDHYLAASVVDWLGWYHSYALARLPDKTKTLLDVGCADGRFVYAAASRGIDAYGIDHSERLVAAGNARYAGDRLSVRAAESLSAEGRRFDAVTLFEVIEHVEDPMRLLRIAYALVSPGGVVVVSCPNRLGRPHPPWPLDSPPHHLSRWTPAALRTGLEKSGFETVEIGTSPGHIGLKAVVLQRTRLGFAVRMLRRRASGRAAAHTSHPASDVRLAIKMKDVLADVVSRSAAPLIGRAFQGGQMVAIARRPEEAV